MRLREERQRQRSRAVNSQIGGPPDLTRFRTLAGEAIEHDPVCLDADGRRAVDDQGAGIFHGQETVLRVDPEQLLNRSAEPVRFSAVLIADGERMRADRRPLR
ncbi:hypothetical protein MKK88_10330 [Methylobacterium sp. E-005]|uniref:hypothetical protein n=1 Tax=Methylobacterium sp. E-005 TaxID=2836549 RepID=UPI001FBB216A|nr:hypothetical protein [Methylobacterium sp. E-005]MCJ2086386.1 hypothetical protein [Methylobacterium sp. E-005]